ncbi:MULTISPECIES: efflux RND transporter periplasmic adaptor subunit [Gammaproteobacteria]|uniref:RND family efflux transporter MFP subunit n=2 Tax=Gammaproteobacteria TaxID=1236 RepID=A0A2S6G3D2_9GAMM|nr:MULTISPECIES: efflux RND transporter periplasmic adaptor subunit [Gammaproteobacteria]VZT40355.1 Toluene efflux pump periplasmic linker protein TtgD [Pseudomonas aeruginosa]HIC49677.1 efflux RND transporter periplasmic adaptor subunit [Dehalococcoidia bacterium]HIM19045.1 efflux RND transporter periplasmic adaptor subunit [Rhodospirillales bacterium]KXS34597.1 MAG: RND family efflux transporter MFP subunit [Idiomarina sp. T82-3]PPK51147.1 RND family efflux transporter MFP subunit [Marinobac
MTSLIYINDQLHIYYARANRVFVLGMLICTLLLLQGCSEEPTQTATENVRAVSINSVADDAYVNSIRFPGVTQTENRSQLSFGVDGTVNDVLFDIGAQLNTGDVMAVLDQEPYRLALESARSEAEKARVTFEEAKTNYERLVRLRENNSVSEQNLDAARSTYENAQSTLRDALAQIRLAERNLSKTAIKAPYDGVISSRSVEPFEEVTANQVAFTFDGMEKFIVDSSIPGDLAEYISNDKELEITVNYRGSYFNATVEHLGERANEGLNFPVRLRLDTSREKRPLPGLVVSVSYRMPDGEGAIFVPHSAVVAEPTDGNPFVYQYNEKTGRVSKAGIRIVNAEEGGYWIKSDLQKGDSYVAAGAAFISEGQKVRPAEEVR